jgi:hypothetical protein
MQAQAEEGSAAPHQQEGYEGAEESRFSHSEALIGNGITKADIDKLKEAGLYTYVPASRRVHCHRIGVESLARSGVRQLPTQLSAT